MFGHVLGPLVKTEQVSHIRVASLVGCLAESRSIQSQHSDRAGVDHPLASTKSGSFQNVEHASDIDVVEVFRPGCPEPVHGGQVKDESCATARFRDGIGVSHVHGDLLDREAHQVPDVPIGLDERRHLGLAGQKCPHDC